MTAQPFVPRTEHPDYVRTKAAREAAVGEWEAAREARDVLAAVIADQVADLADFGGPAPSTVDEYRSARNAVDEAWLHYEVALHAWQEVRTALGLDQCRPLRSSALPRIIEQLDRGRS